ncbi:cytokine receptor isoform X2 [Phymastichus coffea]|nr:cytokine receptor isoform X2 [Phymastichus coffea]
MQRRTCAELLDDMESRRRRRLPPLAGGTPPPMLLLLLLLLLIVLVDAAAAQCARGIQTPGRTWPAGDIVLEHGNPLHIQCILSETAADTYPGVNSSSLVFFKGPREIEPEYVSVINATAVQLYIARPAPENAMYYCKLKLDRSLHDKDHEAVCLNKVVVGFKPQEPRVFDCWSNNWQNMTCRWEPPHNYVDTDYTITFKLPGRAGNRKLYPCPTDKDKDEHKDDDKKKKLARPRNSCFWGPSTDPIYRQPYEYYTFFLTGYNVLGNWSGTFKFHHYAHVIPAKPTNFTVVNKTLDSVLLHWDVAFPMQTFPPGMHHRVAYQNQWDSQDEWQIINITDDCHVSNRYYNLTSLKYANTIYDIRVWVKSAVAVGETKWSNYSDVTFRTPAQVPGRPPRTDVGSFEITESNQNRDIYLYWQTIPAWLENGNNFRYHVTRVVENGQSVILAPNETTRTYARFRGLAHEKSYHFDIVTVNDVGQHDSPARIYVPSRNSLPKEPIAFTKIAFEDGLYELSWKAPIGGDKEITNYTIFWCENDRDRPYQCQGYLEWIHVPKHSRVHNITVPDPKRVYQFAISANTKYASSGMMWASCTVIHNKVVGKMKTVWINRIGSTTIEVGWKLDCSDRIGIVDGFRIYYCPIVSPYNSKCKEPMQNSTIKADLNTIRGEVQGLKPYTTYMIAVSVVTKNGEGQQSDPLYNTTLESPPSKPPSDVVVSQITNSTVHLKWKPPIAMNGVLRYYLVYYNDLIKKVEEVPEVGLDQLVAAHNYSIRVSACTVGCSEKSSPVYVFTDIGVPDKIQPPLVRFVNSSQVKVLWPKPHRTAGPINYYQVKSNDGEILNTTTQEASIGIPDCKTVGREKLYKFQVRAVNIAPHGEHLYGNWSDAGEGNCFSNGPSYRVWVVIWVIGSICGIAFVFCVAYSSKRVWVKCKAMQDVEVKLPPGLAPNMQKLLQKGGDQHIRQPSADSSGCSTGQDSVTSSLTSESQVSNDSGAVDVDPTTSNDKLIIDATTNSTSSPAWESSSLRQRNVAGSKFSSDTTTRWDPYVKVAKGSSDLVMPSTQVADSLSLARSTPNLSDNLGYNASPQTWSSTGYISMPSSEEMSCNSSPVPSKTSVVGSYSVVGLPSKSSLRCKSEEKTCNTLTKTELESKKNPYVSIDLLKQTPKDQLTKRALDSLQVFDDLKFDTTNKHLEPEKLSRPYVQAAMLESKKSPFDARQKAQPTPNFFVQTTLAEDLASKLSPNQMSDTKPYVTVGAIPELVASKPTANILPSASTTKLMETKSNAGYTAVGLLLDTKNNDVSQLAMPMLHPEFETSSSADETDNEQTCLYPSLDLEMNDDTLSSTSSLPASTFTVCWQPPNDSAKSPSEYAQPQQLTKTTSGYVTLPEQQKPVPASRFAAQSSSTEEQYSKVAVVPRAVH